MGCNIRSKEDASQRFWPPDGGVSSVICVARIPLGNGSDMGVVVLWEFALAIPGGSRANRKFNCCKQAITLIDHLEDGRSHPQ